MNLFNKLKDMKILLIDDDKWIRDSLSMFFECEGCHLLVLETAEEGLEAIKGQDYNIVIVDYQLPGIDGLEFLKRIQDSHLDAIKILITAYRSEELVSEAKRMGIQDFIENPFTSKAIEESLVRMIEEREKRIGSLNTHNSSLS